MEKKLHIQGQFPDLRFVKKKLRKAPWLQLDRKISANFEKEFRKKIFQSGKEHSHCALSYSMACTTTFFDPRRNTF